MKFIDYLASFVGWSKHHNTAHVLDVFITQVLADQDAAHRMGYKMNCGVLRTLRQSITYTVC